jgi:hypothetical protein
VGGFNPFKNQWLRHLFIVNLSDCRRYAPASLSGWLQPAQKPVASPLIYSEFIGLPSLCSGILEWVASTSSKTSGFATYFFVSKRAMPFSHFSSKFCIKASFMPHFSKCVFTS